jgi:site-specific DNA recombinase
MSRYVIYARKSTEDEDRQILSIDSQVKELKDLAAREQLKVAKIVTESRSAKAPGRPLFNELVRQVNRRSFDGIIAWKLDRLARNPVDGAALIWTMEEEKIKEIVIPGRRFTNRGDDKFWMQLEFGMAKKYVDDLSDNVRRGNRAKLELGWLPGQPRLGYLNDPLTRTIVNDPKRFPLVKKIWRLILGGESPMRVYRLSRDRWGLRTRPTKNGGGGPLSISSYYALLGDPFYCGIIHRAKGTWAGRHEPMVSREEFAQVQKMLGRPNRLGDRSREFAFTGLIRCGECGSSVTAERKVNRYGSVYVYYHCTRKKPGVRCRQRVIRVEKLEEQILDRLRRISVPRPHLEWMLKHLGKLHAEERNSRAAAIQSLAGVHEDLKRQLNTLTDLRLRGVLPDEEFLKKREELVGMEMTLRENRAVANGQGPDWLELSEKAFSFANQAEKRFREGSITEKREILTAVGSNLTLKDRNLSISLQKPFLLLEKGSAISGWCGLAEGIRTFFREHPTLIPLPAWALRKHRTMRTTRPVRGRSAA